MAYGIWLCVWFLAAGGMAWGQRGNSQKGVGWDRWSRHWYVLHEILKMEDCFYAAEK